MEVFSCKMLGTGTRTRITTGGNIGIQSAVACFTSCLATRKGGLPLCVDGTTFKVKADTAEMLKKITKNEQNTIKK